MDISLIALFAAILIGPPLIFSFSIFFLIYTFFAVLICKILNRKYKVQKQFLKLAPFGIIGPLVFVGGIFFLLDKLMCGEIGKPPVISPDGKYEAQITDHDCGATTAFNSIIVLREKGKMFGQSNSVAEFYHVDPKSLELEWKGNREVHISSPVACVPFDSYGGRKNWKDVKITYVVCNNGPTLNGWQP